MRQRKIILLTVILALLTVSNSACVRRKLTIRTEPTGADVYFNDKYMGTTPVEFDFEWYWKHLVVIEKEGYKKLKNYETIKAPPYMWIPFDLVIELLPVPVRDYRELTYQLTPEEDTGELEGVTIEEMDFGPANKGAGSETGN